MKITLQLPYNSLQRLGCNVSNTWYPKIARNGPTLFTVFSLLTTHRLTFEFRRCISVYCSPIIGKLDHILKRDFQK